MKKTIILFILSCILNGFAQTKIDCEQLLSKEINTDWAPTPQFKIDFSNLKECGLETVDFEIFSNPVILALLTMPNSNSSTKEKLTYGKLLEKINDYKKTNLYPKIRELFELSVTVAKIENWEQDKIRFESLNLNEPFIEDIHNYVKENSNSKTYKEIFNIVSTPECYGESEPKIEVFSNSGNINFKEELKKANNQNKSLVILFSGHSCINSRKMEQLITANRVLVKTLQNKYHLLTLFLDDRASLSKSEYYTSQFTKKKVTTVGQKHFDLQQEKCQTSYQPFLAVFDSDGTLIKSQSYTVDENELLQFLN